MNSQVLTADADIACYSGRHITVMVFAALGFAVYCLGCGVRGLNRSRPFVRLHVIPCSLPLMAVSALLYIDKHGQHTNQLRIHQFGYLYDR